MGKKLTTEEFISKAKTIHGDKYDYSNSIYFDAKTKIAINCKEHGEFYKIPREHNQGIGCPICSFDFSRLSVDTLLTQFRNIHGDKYDYSKVKYINDKTKIIIICQIHGEFEQIAGGHKIGQSCPKCLGCHMKYTNDEIISRFKDYHGDKYDYSKINYINADTKIIIIDKEYNSEHLILPYDFKNKPSIHNAINKTKFIINSFIKIHDDKYDYSLIDYKNSKEKVKIICPKHGIFEQTPNSHLNGQGCPICKESKGEKEIRNILKNKKISFIRNKRFNDCKHINTLPFDFYLPKLNICIEFNGMQHYKFVKRFHINHNGFKQQQLRDNIKMEYCRDNNIPLIIIDNIEDIVDKLQHLINI